MRTAINVFFAAGFAFVAGFFVFVTFLPKDDGSAFVAAGRSFDGVPVSEIGIVVLTGGGGRIERAMALYDEGIADRVLISGTHPTVKKADIARLTPSTNLECCVDLDPLAKTTIENAQETKVWANHHGYQALYVVTSDFHLPRAVVEIRSSAPSMAVVGVPVAGYGMPGSWYRSRDAWQVLTMEYVKFLAAFARSFF